MTQPLLNTIIRGDCLDILPNIPSSSVNFILTDPPYIAKYQSRDGRRVPNDDNDKWLEPSFAELYRVLDRNSFALSFYGWPHVDKFMGAWRKAGFKVVGHLTFPKRYTSSVRYLRYQHESAYLLAKGNPRPPNDPIGDVMDWTYSGNKRHPTEKPLEVILPLVNTFSDVGGTVLDPFCGSGSTLRAAQMLGRNYIGIELDPNYHAIAETRLRDNSEFPVARADWPTYLQP
jgi:adenine-specific DNA-methyltransferase